MFDPIYYPILGEMTWFELAIWLPYMSYILYRINRKGGWDA